MTPTPDVIVFDSSGLISLLVETDSNHTRAVEIAQSLTSQRIDKILPAEVLGETLNILGKKLGNTVAVTAGHAILAQNFFIPYTEPELAVRTLERLVREKPSTSYTDCLVMTWADYYHTTAIFGFDATFTASGYRLP